MHRVKLFIFTIAALLFSQAALAQAPGKQKAVLVTGASTGIGATLAEYLSQRGFYVYAGARKEEDLKRLEAMDNVSAVRLDITKQAEIDAAVAFVRAQGRGLHGVVNNAGVAAVGELMKISEEDILWQHDINILGAMRVDRAFLPLLKESKGRTLVIGSLSGFVTGPGGGAFSMTKFATEAYAETLAMELAGEGVKAGIVDPGSFRARGRERVAIKMLTGEWDLNAKLTPEQEKIIAGVRATEDKRKEPIEVAEQVYHFLTSDTPRVRYMASPDKKTVDMVYRAALRRIAQLNASQPAYALTRDELVTMLDELLVEEASGGK
ncbi:SDR family NAD(P)-dependent oxidoreductase [Sphingosinicella rhizophila]|uniref:SDR family NAD(P)-dependent oxidoreductase n=1 Tax=Sphingosinicella rhizophila TaxID=3050082 RepID=A0ABU3QAA1_9SPHN|nr:SDR family NAD(P)-dependent oxidoreductase [Sphingosinicella sp. GR2756]MDT9600252.1 SDR family NAD(P)-dependent oxidoreductase [Sphingosinicella sp. GR2756]